MYSLQRLWEFLLLAQNHLVIKAKSKSYSKSLLIRLNEISNLLERGSSSISLKNHNLRNLGTQLRK